MSRSSPPWRASSKASAIPDSYAFGDSPPAATRLALLAEVFEATTAAFLGTRVVAPHGRVVDLGCGPGFTTALLGDIVSPRELIGVDASPAFVAEAARRIGFPGDVLCADVRALPEDVRDLDLVFARFLLTHLAEPAEAIRHWLARLAPGGVLALEEVESITTDDPVFARYLDLQRRMLEANGHRLDVGPVLAPAARTHGSVVLDEIIEMRPSTTAAARMFAMNFAIWRARPAVAGLASRAELDELQAGLATRAADVRPASSITWQLRHLNIAAS